MINTSAPGVEFDGSAQGCERGLRRVDVLMPARDASWMLDEAVASILNQRGVSLRLLIIDDCRESAARQRLTDIAAADDRIRIIRSEGIGIVDALNTGLTHVEAEFCARMDADDISLPERLRMQAEWLEEHPDHVLVGGLVRYFDETGALLDPVDWEGLGSPLSPADIEWRLRDHNCVFHPTVMFRTAAVRAVGGYRPDYPHNEDYDLWIRLAKEGKLQNLPFPVLLYRIHGGQVGQMHAEAQEESRLRLITDSFPLAQPSPESSIDEVNASIPVMRRKVREYSCILEITSTDEILEVLRTLTGQSSARLRDLLILHPKGPRVASRIRRALPAAGYVDISVEVASREAPVGAIRHWLRPQSSTRIVILMSEADEASPDRVRLQAAALDSLPGGWALGMASVDSIPRSGLFPSEYLARRPELIAHLDEEHLRSNLCLSVGALHEALPDQESSESAALARAIVSKLDPSLLVEIPVEVSRIRHRSLPTRRRLADQVEILRRNLRAFAARTARALRP